MHVCHKTGEYVPRNMGGVWLCSGHGHVARIRVQGGDVFPPCNSCGAGVTWCYEH
jgi:hypothetical protein